MPGANADMELIRLSLEFMLEHMKENGVKSVNIPQIGCGIGGLKWEEVHNYEHTPHPIEYSMYYSCHLIATKQV